MTTALAADTSGPPDTRPPNKPPNPPPPKDQLADELDCAGLLLQTLAVLDLPGMDPVERMRFDLAVRLGRRAIAASSGRDGKDSVPASASRPVQPRAGQKPPLSGADFLLPRDVRGGEGGSEMARPVTTRPPSKPQRKPIQTKPIRA